MAWNTAKVSSAVCSEKKNGKTRRRGKSVKRNTAKKKKKRQRPKKKNTTKPGTRRTLEEAHGKGPEHGEHLDTWLW
jgi:hypothetical protein